jgi:hypothetical protein
VACAFVKLHPRLIDRSFQGCRADRRDAACDRAQHMPAALDPHARKLGFVNDPVLDYRHSNNRLNSVLNIREYPEDTDIARERDAATQKEHALRRHRHAGRCRCPVGCGLAQS